MVRLVYNQLGELIMKFHLDNNIVEGTPEELVKYQELLEEKEEDLLKSGHMHRPTEEEFQDTFKGIFGSMKIDNSYVGSTEISTDEAETASTELQVGDRVKVLKSELGAEGEATVTAVLEDGEVELAGTNKEGRYLTNWSNHVSNLEKTEDAPKGYTFWYLDGSTFNNRTVLKATLGGHFEDSKGRRYTYQSVHGLVKPINRENVREEFEEAKHSGGILKYYPALDVFSWEK
ncbi:hypothetical protein FMLHJGGC_00057 [Staphylococcus phage BSwM-KMM1]|nr:hypothetical protein FMLHJGGC_00057 [Pseudomonas phage BSwM KMM1]